MLQNTFSAQDPRLYSVERDAAHNFKHVATVVFEKIKNRCWPFLDALLENEGVTDQQLAEAVDAFVRFVATANKVPNTTMDDMMAQSGWLSCHPLAKVAIMAHVGAVQAGIYFKGARDAALKGFTNPCDYQMEAFMAAGRQASELLTATYSPDKQIVSNDGTKPHPQPI